jgi:hypothetical protein
MILKTKSTLKYLAPFFLTALMTSACGSGTQENSAGKVTNGITVKGQNFPSAVLLISVSKEGESICTGTFVNDSQVVSAGHCVEGLSRTRPNLIVATEKDGQIIPLARALSWARNPNYSFNQGVSPYDVSVINFPAKTAPAITPIAAAAPEAGETFTIVGYGDNQNFLAASGALSGAGAGTKRAGSNRISEVASGMISFVGVTGTTAIEGLTQGQYVASGSGDSGGPMFVKGQLVGVTSGGGISQTQDGLELAISFYVDLNSPASKEFLSTVIKR